MMHRHNLDPDEPDIVTIIRNNKNKYTCTISYSPEKIIGYEGNSFCDALEFGLKKYKETKQKEVENVML